MRERMRKLTAAILMLVMVSVMFTACGSNSSDKSDNATQELLIVQNRILVILTAIKMMLMVRVILIKIIKQTIIKM